MIKARAKGSRLERELKHKLRGMGYFVIRQASSSFPDLIALPNSDNPEHKFKRPLLIECKVNKYLKLQEKLAFRTIEKYGEILVAYPVKVGNRKQIILSNIGYKEIMRVM